MNYFVKWLATATTHLRTLFLFLFGKEDVKYRAKLKDNKCFLSKILQSNSERYNKGSCLRAKDSENLAI